MKYLIQGGEPAERMDLLLQLTRIDSVEVIEALRSYYVGGVSESNAATINGVEQSNLARARVRIEKAASVVEKIKEIDWAKFNQLSDINKGVNQNG